MTMKTDTYADGSPRHKDPTTLKNKAAQQLGKLGGQSTSEAKKKAAQKNIAKARLSRWKGVENGSK